MVGQHNALIIDILAKSPLLTVYEVEEKLRAKMHGETPSVSSIRKALTYKVKTGALRVVTASLPYRYALSESVLKEHTKRPGMSRLAATLDVDVKQLDKAREVLDREAHRVAAGIVEHVTKKITQDVVDAFHATTMSKKPTKRPPGMPRREWFAKSQTERKRHY